jgi:hypothetical protein
MEPPGLIKKIQHWVEDESHWLTHRKLIVLGITLILIGLLLGIFDKEEAPEPVARPEIRDLTIPKRPEPPAERDTGDEPPQEATAQAEVDQWQGVKVRPGQTLDAIFRQQGFDVVLLHRILKLSDETRRLTKIRPGDLFEFVKTADGRFDKMRYATDEAHYLLVQMKGTDPEATMIEREIFSEVAEAEGVIDSSLFLAGKKAGLSDAMIMKLLPRRRIPA